MTQMGWPRSLYSWSIDLIHFKAKIFKNEQILSSSFEMAHISVFEYSNMAEFSTSLMVSKIQMCAISKLLDKNCSHFDILPLKCMYVID